MKRVSLCVLLVAASSLAACSRPESSNQAQQAPTPALAPPVVPAAGVYVSNETSGDLSIIDATSGSVVATVPLGKRPRGIAASPDHTTLFIALSGSPAAGPGVDESKLPPPDRSADGIGMVDVRQQKLLRVLTSGPDPEQLAVGRDGKQVFVANEDAAQLSVIDVAQGKITESYKVGEEPEGVSVSPIADQVWVTSETDGAVYVIDLSAHKVLKSIKVGSRPRSIAFTPDGTRAYVPSENAGTLSVIDAKRLVVVKTIDLGKGIRAMGTAMAPDGKTVFVSTGRSKLMFAVNTKTNKVLGSVDVGARPWGITISPDGKTLYTANGPSNDVSIVDAATRQVTKHVPVGEGPWGLVFVPRPAAAQ